MLRALLLLVLLSGSLVLPRTATAQVHRCVAAGGSIVYTDRRCPDIGATALAQPPPGTPTASRIARSMCARSIPDLAYSLGNAIRSGDANRIASLYDWAGMGTRTANRIMDRFEVMASRALVDVTPIYATPAPDPVAAATAPSTVAAPTHAATPPADGSGRTSASAAASAPPRLVGLRVEQVLANGHTPWRASFGIRARMGCWWIHD